MLMLHGATWLSLKTDGAVNTRARRRYPLIAGAFIVLFVACGHLAAWRSTVT